MQEKPHDYWTLPMHREWHTAQHDMNERRFWLHRGIYEPLTIAEGLYNTYPDQLAGEEYIRDINRRLIVL